MASEWQGGTNFHMNRRGSSTAGQNNDGAQRKRQNLTKRWRFNPHPTRTGHPACVVHAQARRDIDAFQKKVKAGKYPFKKYVSKVKNVESNH